MERAGQGELFSQDDVEDDQDPEPSEKEPDNVVALSPLLAEVVFNRPLRQAFDYSVPMSFVDEVEPGRRVLAPFGRGSHRTTGFCVGVKQRMPIQEASPLKSLVKVLDPAPLVSSQLLELGAWVADRYHCGWGQVLEAIVPSGVKHAAGVRWVLVAVAVATPEQSETSLTNRQQAIYDALMAVGGKLPLLELTRTTRSSVETVKKLVDKGWIRLDRERQTRGPTAAKAVLWTPPLTLNNEQQAALTAITATVSCQRHDVFLLHGVTGSGKTEVYLQAIREVIEAGREAIVLVPEISLTPQTIERFRERFDQVAVLHSHLSDVDRQAYWRRVAAGEARVIIGARSAVFAPCPQLGMIVIDEEHETTFKQETTPRYHARDVAIERGRRENIPVILGSATPALECWERAQRGEYTLLTLSKRVADRVLPRVEIIDLRGEYRAQKGFRALARPLVMAMEKTLAAGGQVILLLNRRGFSTTLLCPHCGYVAKCDHCAVSLTYHRRLAALVCHTCDTDYPLPAGCPACRQPAIRYAGIGTERLEDEVARTFPGVAFARMDSDTMRSVNEYERVLGSFRWGETKILLGTQMIAKGLDFPNVHLVGVVAADIARHLPDFRSAERTFQLIAQVAGRTGRGDKPGRVLVQTFNPDDPAIVASSRHDYLALVAHELPTRREFGYPPFLSLARLVVRSLDESLAEQAAQCIADHLRGLVAAADSAFWRVLGPAPAPVAKLRDYYRFHLQIHGPIDARWNQLFDPLEKQLDLPNQVEWIVDIDPMHWQ